MPAGVNVFDLMAADYWLPVAKAELNLKLPLGRAGGQGELLGYESTIVASCTSFLLLKM